MATRSSTHTYRTWGEDPELRDSLHVQMYQDEDGNPVSYQLTTRSSHGALAFIGFTPREFIEFVCDLEEMI